MSDPLVALLAPVMVEAQHAWGVVLDPRVFANHIATVVPDVTADTLARLHVVDLYLAAACTHGEPTALAIFEQQFMSQVPVHLRRIDPSPMLAQEVQQLLRMRLFVGDGDRAPAIASYTGRGALGAWLRVAAVRTLHDLHRAQRSDVPIDDDQAIAASAHDPQLSLLKRRYAGEFSDAIKRAINALPAVDRNILRWHYVDGLTTDAIGKLQRVDGSTIRRKLTGLRQRLLADVRTQLVGRLGLNESSLEGLMNLVRSRLDVSLSAQLRRAR